MAATTTTEIQRAQEAVQTSNAVQGRMLPDEDESETESSDEQESVVSSADFGTVEIQVDRRLNMHPSPSALEVATENNYNRSGDVLRVEGEMDAAVHLTTEPQSCVGLERDHHHFSRPSVEKPTKSDIIVNYPPVDLQAVENAFGIAYRPHGLTSTTTQEYHIPSGPAFIDEDEFEAQLSTEFRVVPGGIVSPEACLTPASEGNQGRGSKVGVREHDQDREDTDFVGESTPRSIGDNKGETIGGKDCSHVQSQLDRGSSAIQSFDIQKEGSKELEILAETYQADGSATKAALGEKIGGGTTQAGSKTDGAIERQPTAANETELRTVGYSGDGEVIRFCTIEEEDEEEISEHEADGVQQDEVGEIASHVQPYQGQKQEEEGDNRARVAQEWDAIDQLRTAENSVPMERGVGGALKPRFVDAKDKTVTNSEALAYFRSQDLSAYKSSIICVEPRQQPWSLFRRPPSLRIAQAEKYRDEIFFIAQVHYTPMDVMHRRILQTIYRRMTGEKRVCPDEGPHWDTVGFQGNDPRTDLNRSMGVFSLLQVLCLLETQPAFAAKLYRISTADVTGWPFLCVSIGFTKEAVGTLRRGDCYAECNRQGSVLEVVHELHQAQFYAFLALCHSKPATHHAVHLSKVRDSMQKESTALVTAYRRYLSEKKDKAATGIAVVASGGREGKLEFEGGDERGETEKAAQRGRTASSRKSRYITSEEASSSETNKHVKSGGAREATAILQMVDGQLSEMEIRR